MSVTIRPVRSRRERKAFLDVAFRLNAAEPMWTPPLRDDLERSLSDDNPLWNDGRGARELFLAYRGDEPVGRIMAHVHHASNERYKERAGFFGLFETSDDREVAGALLDAAADHHRSKGLELLRGPYDLNIRECIGCVVEGFEEPASFSQGWNAPHVPRLLAECGFEVVYRATTLRLDDVFSRDPDALLGDKQRQWLKDPKVTLRGIELDRFESDVRAAVGLLNESFGDNFGFVPMSEAEVEFMAGPMKRVLRPEITVFLEYDGEPVGVGMLLPDFHVLFRRMGGSLFPLGWAQFLLGSRRLDAGVVQFIATSPKLQNKGVMRVVAAELVRRVQQAGIRTIDGTWIGDSNAKSLATALALGMRPKHKLALFARAL